MSRRSSEEESQRLGLPPAEGSIYERAVTHRSFAFEQSEPVLHNERLEFLGDAVLGALVAEFIFDRYADFSPGQMTRLRAAVVERPTLARLARRLGIGASIRLGKGEEASGGRDKPSLLADALEALIAALYLDKGLDETRSFVADHFEDLIAQKIEEGGGYDAKSSLQEFVMRRDGALPHYQIVTSGPEHHRSFKARVFVRDRLTGSGIGRTKKEAEQEAAREALAKILKETEQGDPDARAS